MADSQSSRLASARLFRSRSERSTQAESLRRASKPDISGTARPDRPTTKRGQLPQPSRLPNGKSKLGQLNTSRWLHESMPANGQIIGHAGSPVLHSAEQRLSRRNERNRTGTFPRSNSQSCSCCVDRQLCCSGRVPWEPSGAVPFIWCPSFDFPFCRLCSSALVVKNRCAARAKR